MQRKYIAALAEVLDVNIQEFDGMSQEELLTMLERKQQRAISAIQ